MPKKLENVDQCNVRKHADGLIQHLENVEGFGITAQREMRRAVNKIKEARDLAHKAMGRRRTEDE